MNIDLYSKENLRALQDFFLPWIKNCKSYIDTVLFLNYILCDIYRQFFGVKHDVREQNCAICRDMDKPGDCHTKSEKEKQMLYNIAYMWNLEK